MDGLLEPERRCILVGSVRRRHVKRSGGAELFIPARAYLCLSMGLAEICLDVLILHHPDLPRLWKS